VVGVAMGDAQRFHRSLGDAGFFQSLLLALSINRNIRLWPAEAKRRVQRQRAEEERDGNGRPFRSPPTPTTAGLNGRQRAGTPLLRDAWLGSNAKWWRTSGRRHILCWKGHRCRLLDSEAEPWPIVKPRNGRRSVLFRSVSAMHEAAAGNFQLPRRTFATRLNNASATTLNVLLDVTIYVRSYRIF